MLIVGFSAARIGWRSFVAKPAKDAAPIAIAIEKGESFKSLTNELKEKKIIGSPLVFRAIERLTGAGGRMQAGEHTFYAGMSYAAILAELTVGNQGEITVTIPEGFTLDQIGDRLQKELGLKKADWLAMVGVNSPLENEPFVVAAKKPANVDLEGYLFPDTYRFPKNVTVDVVARTMLTTMEARVTALGVPTGDAAAHSVHELLTLSSIVEKEVRTPESMKNVADVFYKRLQIGMALQSDATLNYIIKSGKAALSLNDLENDSAYNTYKHPGLPPSPISNPGLNALTAVWHPANNPYLFFLTSASGRVYYAATFEEHVANKGKAARE